MILVLEGVLLELAAPRCLSLGLVAPLVLARQGHWQLAALTVVLAQAVRALVRRCTWQELAANLGIAGLTVPTGLYGLLAYPFVSWAIPVALSREVRHRDLRRDAALVGLLVPCLAWLQLREPWWTLPVLACVQLLLWPRSLPDTVPLKEQLEASLLARHTLTQELAVLEALSRSLAACATLKASVATILHAARSAVPGSICALYEADEGPPLAREAFARRVRVEGQDPPAVACWLEAGGVLYWEGQHAPSAAQLALLAVIADQASLALESGRQRDELEARRLAHQQWVDRLVTVLDGLRELVSTPDLLPGFARLVERCVPHRGGTIEGLYQWGEPGPGLEVSAEGLTVRLHGTFDRDQETLVGLLTYLLSVLYRRAQSQQQLVQASKLAAVGQLAAGVAHELNTPLGAISLNLEALGKQVASTPLKRVEIAATACRQCQEIVEKLLVFCRKEDGNKPLSLNEVLAETLLLVRSHLSRGKITLTTDLGEVPPVLANRNDLQQVLTNLIMNAAQVARQITVRTWVKHGAVLLSVKDNGPGMPPEVLARAFEPFFTTKPVGQGTGLGLSISREVMAKLGGEVHLESRLGEGTTALVRLPCAS